MNKHECRLCTPDGCDCNNDPCLGCSICLETIEEERKKATMSDDIREAVERVRSMERELRADAFDAITDRLGEEYVQRAEDLSTLLAYLERVEEMQGRRGGSRHRRIDRRRKWEVRFI